MSEVNSVGGTGASSDLIMKQLSSAAKISTEYQKDVAVVQATLQTQMDALMNILQALGIGQNVDTTA
jgi:hypothetical protein